MNDTTTRRECSVCGQPWEDNCGHHNAAPVERTYVAVDALLSEKTANAAGWAETMAHGRIGTDAATAVLHAAVEFVAASERNGGRDGTR